MRDAELPWREMLGQRYMRSGDGHVCSVLQSEREMPGNAKVRRADWLRIRVRRRHV